MNTSLLIIQGSAGLALAAVGGVLLLSGRVPSIRLCGGGLLILGIGLLGDLAVAWMLGGPSSFEIAPATGAMPGPRAL